MMVTSTIKSKIDQEETMKDEQSKSEDNSSNDGNDNETGEINCGWANSIAKVLQTSKPKSKKSMILSRAKKLSNVKVDESSKINYNFEIDGEIKDEKPDKDEINENLKKSKEINKKLLLRMKPSIKDREREKVLKKIATKGVVQLFNAVRVQQKDIDKQLEEAGPLDHRKDAVLNNINKRKFLNVLMGGDRAKSELVDNAVKDEIKDESSNDDDDDDNNEKLSKRKKEWSVLRNDFMTNKKLKNWDQESDDDINDKPKSDDEDSE